MSFVSIVLSLSLFFSLSVFLRFFVWSLLWGLLLASSMAESSCCFRNCSRNSIRKSISWVTFTRYNLTHCVMSVMLWLELMTQFCEQGFSFAIMEFEESSGHEGQQHRAKQKWQRRALCTCARCKGLHLCNESIIRNHMIKWGPSIVVDDVSLI